MEDEDWVVVRPPCEKDQWSPSAVNADKEDDPSSTRPLKLTFREPSKHWTDALPIGNGRLGAMVWGGVATETLQLNGTKHYFAELFAFSFKNVNCSIDCVAVSRIVKALFFFT